MVGLDFGTTTTLVAQPTGVVILGESTPWMPSLVGCDERGELVAGGDAEVLPPGRVIRSVKRCITSGDQTVALDEGTREVAADDLMVAVLREAARRGAELGAGFDRPGAVRLGCPAIWDGRQRRRLLSIAKRAGIAAELADLVDEPVAAGIAWVRRVRPTTPRRLVVFDMGGGTLDIAVLDVRGGPDGAYELAVLAAIGSAVAGDALDAAVAADIEDLLAIDLDALDQPVRARGRIAHAAREAKVALTTDTGYVVALPARVFGGSSQELTYGRERLEAAFAPLMDRAEDTLIAALRSARLTELDPEAPQEIRRMPLPRLFAGVDVVVLSGGMSRVPYVADRLRALFGATTPIEPAIGPGSTDGGPESAVALGLAHAGDHGRVNMFRPAVDVFVDTDHGSRLVYEAFTPVVASWQTFVGGTQVRYVRNGRDLEMPRTGHGRLRVVSHTGADPRATLAGKSLDGFPVALSDQCFEFCLYPNGRLRMVDAAGEYEGRIDDWHVMQLP